MSTYARIKNGKVSNIEVSKSGGPDLVLVKDGAGIGWLWDGTTFTPPAGKTYRQYTYAMFIIRFVADGNSRAMRGALRGSSPSSYDLETLMELFRAEGFIDFDDEVVRELAISALVPSVLTSEELDKIMAV